MRARHTALAALAIALFFSLAACAHKDLTAPCSSDESDWFSDCGRLRPVNSQGATRWATTS